MGRWPEEAGWPNEAEERREEQLRVQNLPSYAAPAELRIPCKWVALAAPDVQRAWSLHLTGLCGHSLSSHGARVSTCAVSNACAAFITCYAPKQCSWTPPPPSAHC